MLGYESWAASDDTQPVEECGQLGCQQGWLPQELSKTWAATWLLIKLTPNGVVFCRSFASF